MAQDQIEADASEIDEATIQRAIKFAHSKVQNVIIAQKEAASAHTGCDYHTLPEVVTIDTASSQPDIYGVLDTTLVTPDVHIWRRGSLVRSIWKPPQHMINTAVTIGYSDAIDVFAMTSIPRPEQSKLEGRARYNILQALRTHDVYGKYSEVTRAMAAEEVMSMAFRDRLLLSGKRIDGRQVDTLRPIHAYHDVLPSVHGSGFFQRGDTHVLGTVTLGDRQHARVVEAIDGTGEVTKYFYLHYDFPPYCTGEVGNATAVNRRMIGHGRLAEKSLLPVLPSQRDFPYSVRVFAECTSSSGSSSMASVCAASLSLMDAGVPISRPVAGVSIGILANPEGSVQADRYKLLSDIMGMEDHYGDMDFKIAGTKKGITAMQLDVKLADGIPVQGIMEAVDKACAARLSILEEMNASISSARSTVKSHSPLAVEILYDPDRKRHLIGPGGEMIRFIENTYECEINTEEDGVAHVFGYNRPGVREAEQLIMDLLIEPQEGDVHMAQVGDEGCVCCCFNRK